MSTHLTGFSDLVAGEIRAEMIRKKMRQGELAARLGWSQPKLGRRLSDKASFTLAEVDRIAGILGTPLARLLSPELALCEYCERAKWWGFLEPCCDRPEHAGRLVCTDAHDCMGVIMMRLHDQQHRELGAEL